MERQNNAKIMIVGLLLSAIIVSGGFYYIQTQAEEVENSTYENSEYGFILTFPDSWEGYGSAGRILDWGDLGTSDSVDFGFEEDSFFNISIHSKTQWTQIEASDGPRPQYLGENGNCIFAYSIAQDYNQQYGQQMDQIPNIIETFALKTPTL